MSFGPVCLPDGSDWFAREWVVDMSGCPVELVAAHAPLRLLEDPPVRLIHPDLWHDGVWVDR